jgi:hypothetical protein
MPKNLCNPNSNKINHPNKPPPADETTIHIGWLHQLEDASFTLEKDFRALRTWFSSPRSWQYDLGYIRNSMRMQTPGCPLRLFWFPDIEGEPWFAGDVYAIAGAVERMRGAGREVCFFAATRAEHVRALTCEQGALERAARYVYLGHMGPVGS